MIAALEPWSKLFDAARDTAIDAASIARLAAQVQADSTALPKATTLAVDRRDGHAATALVLAGACAGVAPTTDGVEGVLPLTADPALTAILLGAALGGDRASMVFDLVDNERLDPDCAAMALLVVALDLNARGKPFPPKMIALLRRLCRRDYPRDGHLALAAILILVEDEALTRLGVPHTSKAMDRPVLTDGISDFAGRCLKRPVPELLAEIERVETIYGHTVERQGPKVGRNDPCPCGSGRKHKRCCMGKEPAYRAPGSPLAGVERRRRVVDAARLSAEELAELRYPDIAPLDLASLPTPHLLVAFDRFLDVRDWQLADRAVTELERRNDLPTETSADECRLDLIRTAAFAKDVSVLRQQATKLRRRDLMGEETHLRMVIAADLPNALPVLEQRCQRALERNETADLYRLCAALIQSSPALGTLVARGALDPEHPAESEDLLNLIDDARDDMLLPLGDPAEARYLRLEDALAGTTEHALSEELLRAKNDLAEARAEKTVLESRVRELSEQAEAARSLTPEPATPGAAGAGDDPHATRDKVRELKRIVAELQEERAELRAQLARARAVAVAPAADPPPPAGPPPEAPPVEEAVLALTRGKRVLFIGGQGARVAHRAAIQAALELAELEWPVAENRQASYYSRLRERIRPGAFDFVLFLAGYSGHNSAAVLDDCKTIGLPVVYVRRGYSVTQVARAIGQQLSPT